LECFKIQCFNDTCGCQPGSSPCNPLGKCAENPGGSPICTCTFNLNIDPTANCQNCKDKYWGFPDCRTCDYCNQGKCSLTNGSCLCNPHFNGSSCSTCDINWTGDNCDKAVVTNNKYTTVIIVVLVVLAVIATAAGILYYYSRFKQNSIGSGFKKLINWNTEDDDILGKKEKEDENEKDAKEDEKGLVDNEDKSNLVKSNEKLAGMQVKKITAEDDELFQPRSKKTDEVFTL